MKDWIRMQLNIDSCLDKGGCWDSIRNYCEIIEQGKCVKNAKECKEKYNGKWNMKNKYCIISE